MFNPNTSLRRRRANVKSFLGGATRKPFNSLNEEDDDYSLSSSSSSQPELTTPANAALATVVEFEPTRTQQQHQEEEDAKFVELDGDLNDMDNYMLSVYMNEDCSVYSKGTAETSLSSRSSTSSILSTRKRHKGAYWKRRMATRERMTWMESMQGADFCQQGSTTWTAQTGWQITPGRQQWDSNPDDSWREHDELFDQIPRKRLEI